MSEFPHTPVMLDRCVDLLSPALGAPGAVAIDATLGMGGHAEALLERHPELTLVGIDRDPDAIRIAGERLARFGDRIRIVEAVYDEIDDVLEQAGVDRLDGILFDLGVSSLQLDVAERGFAYSKDAPLDMRMDQQGDLTAADVIAEYDEETLGRIFRRYGDERLAKRYATHIVRARQIEPILTSQRLVQVLSDATPAALRNSGHPAKRVFQALRIEVNQELAVLERAIPAALDRLVVGGRIVVMSYQSLEDRIVKRSLAAAAASTAPADLPAELPEHRPNYALLIRGAELADDEERARNSRSIPVRLRAAERIASTRSMT